MNITDQLQNIFVTEEGIPDPLRLPSEINQKEYLRNGELIYWNVTGRKDSVEGTLSVVEALRSFSIRSLVAAKLNVSNKQLLNNIVQSHHSNFLSTQYIF